MNPCLIAASLLYAVGVSYLANPVSTAAISIPTFSQGQVSFTYESGPEQVFTVQAADLPTGTWTNLVSQRGTGSPIQFSTPPTAQQRFFRIQATLFQPLDFGPNSPTLTSGDVSLPDAVSGLLYSESISPAEKGIPPYTLQVSGTPPDGVSLVITSNGTANASIKVSSTGTTLVAGQRRQFTISGTDSTTTATTRIYDLRVIPPPPQIETTLLTMKAGESANLPLTARHGSGNLTWEIVAGPKPASLTMSAAGRFTGIPTAEDAEFQETGRYTNQVKVTDSLTDRVTGAPSPRATTNTIVQLIKLSYQQNLLGDRPVGPRFAQTCVGCHGPGFTPDMGGLASDIILVDSQPFGACPDRAYVVPGSPQTSLLYRKLTTPDCGVRMPASGPFYDDVVLKRIERWISELTPQDVD